MSISYIWQKGKILAQKYLSYVYIALCSFLGAMICIGSYTIHYLHTIYVPLTIDPAPLELQAPEAWFKADGERMDADNKNPAEISTKLKLFVASKRGTAYYSFGCKAGQSIATANQIWFATRAEAENAGYKPSKSCKDLN